MVNKYNSQIEKYINDFAETRTPIEVSFRQIVPELNNPDRGTHLIHTYPAKLLMHIPYFFLNNTIFSKRGQTVFDPFCGTGTVLLEAMMAGRKAVGSDANPLARLIAEVKTSSYSGEDLKDELTKLLKRTRLIKLIEIPSVVNIDYWFPQKTQVQLGKLFKGIQSIKDKKKKDFFLVCLSNCIKKVSYADPRISVPVKLNPKRYEVGSKEYKNVTFRLVELEDIDVISKFKTICLENIKRINEKNKILHKGHGKIISTDARKIKAKDGSVDLIITSPPYAGAQKYIRSSSLSLGWLRMAKVGELRGLDDLNIGRENYQKHHTIAKTGIESADMLIEQIAQINFTRALIVSNYLREMQCAIDESVRLLKKDGYFVIIVGNNKVCNKEFNTQQYFTEYLQQKGLKLMFKLIDDIRSYGLMTKRNKTADRISREWILVFTKK